MRGIWLVGHGDIDQLEVRSDIPTPSPGPYDVLIQVSAAAVNNTDINTRIAWYSKSNGSSDDASWSGSPTVTSNPGLRPGGRYAVAGAIAGPLVELDLRTLYLKDLSFFGCRQLDAGVFANLIRLIEMEAIQPVVAQTFPLEEIVAAQAAFMAKQHIGKIVLTVSLTTEMGGTPKNQ